MLRSLTEGHRDRLMSFISSLSEDAFRQGDLVETDRDGRLHQVSVVGKYALYFWTDRAAKEIRITDLVDADQK